MSLLGICRVLTVVTVAAAEWISSPRYGPRYVGGFQAASSTARVVRCVPCHERSSSATNSLNEYRGNGADNLGYDWSPKAWGGPAFPNKVKINSRESESWLGGRGGRKMPGSWDKCPDCSQLTGQRSWGEKYTERPRNWDEQGERDSESWRSSTRYPYDEKTTGPPDEATVTSQVLGIMYRNDKRVSIPWQSDSRSMRWDGFRNGIPWDSNQQMSKRSWSEESGSSPWDGTGKEVSGRDSQGKGHYASNWSYGSPTMSPAGAQWNRPWTASDERRQSDERGYGQSGGLPFGSTYPHQSANNYPQSSNNNPTSYPQQSNYPTSAQYPVPANYPTERPYYSTSSWRPTTGAYPSKNHYIYPTTNRPQPTYPEIIHHRPSYHEDAARPGYGDNKYSTERPNYRPQGASWNYQDRYDQQWTTPRPNQNYLPQNPRPGYGVDRPSGGIPSITIWNGGPNEYDSRPVSTPLKGQYTGFITEINDSNYIGGNSRPSNSDRYPFSDKYPQHSQYPTSHSRPNSDRYPSSSSSGHRYPSSDRYPSDSYPTYESNSRPGSGNRYDRPAPEGYPSNRPTGSRYPSSRPTQDRYPNIRPGSDRYPSNQPVDPWHYSDRNPPNYGNDRYPSQGGKYPTADRYPSYDRQPNTEGDRGSSYDKDRYPSYDRDRYPYYDNERYPSSGADRYPSRPGSSDHDRGPPLPSSDSGSWNYGEQDENKDGTYKRSGGSYPPYKGGKVFTSSYLASASTPASSHDIEGKKPTGDETTTASSQEQ